MQTTAQNQSTNPSANPSAAAAHASATSLALPAVERVQAWHRSRMSRSAAGLPAGSPARGADEPQRERPNRAGRDNG